MLINEKNVEIANRLRVELQSITETVSDGEGVVMVLLWSFFLDHAKCDDIDIEELAQHQVQAFIDYARNHVALVRSWND